MLKAIVNPYWGTKTLTRTYICPNIDLCKNTDCMHSKPHEPVFHGPNKADNCTNACICPLLGVITKCIEWEQ